jgi:hypothetical protein
VAGIIGIPGRLQSESVAAFDRNPRPISSESAGVHRIAALVTANEGMKAEAWQVHVLRTRCVIECAQNVGNPSRAKHAYDMKLIDYVTRFSDKRRTIHNCAWIIGCRCARLSASAVAKVCETNLYGDDGSSPWDTSRQVLGHKISR